MGHPERESELGDATVVGFILQIAVPNGLMYEYFIFIVHPFHHIYKIRVSAIRLLTKGDKGQSLISESIDRILRKNIQARNINQMIVGDDTAPKQVEKIHLKDVPGNGLALFDLLPKDWDHEFTIKNMTELEDLT